MSSIAHACSVYRVVLIQSAATTSPLVSQDTGTILLRSSCSLFCLSLHCSRRSFPRTLKRILSSILSLCSLFFLIGGWWFLCPTAAVPFSKLLQDILQYLLYLYCLVLTLFLLFDSVVYLSKEVRERLG